MVVGGGVTLSPVNRRTDSCENNTFPCTTYVVSNIFIDHIPHSTISKVKFIMCIFFFSVLNKRGVFSGPANMSRLKAQLALDANKL